MRIIAGTHRGRTLVAPKDDSTTRPITDRVKENLFNRLHSLGVLGYGRTVDVFSGTGSLGLEALSRGATHCTFIEQDRDARERLEENLDALGIADDHYRIVQGSAFPPLWVNAIPDGSLTLAFLDPPYAMTADLQPIHDLLAALVRKLEPGGVAMLRTPSAENIHAAGISPGVTPDELPGYDGPVTIPYGSMTLHFYQVPLDEDAQDEEVPADV